MDLNIYAQRLKPFNFSEFKKSIELFLINNQIQSTNPSKELGNVLAIFKSLIQKEVLNKDETYLNKNTINLNQKFIELEKSEIYENLLSNEKRVISTLLLFSQQYIEVLKNNKYYYNDQIIQYENQLLKTNVQEMFNYSKTFFMLSLKNKKWSFEDNIKKEIEKMQKNYGFKEIFFRKSRTIRDKVMLLKNLKDFKEALNNISIDLKIDKKKLSFNNLISISFEPTILGYSAAKAYMSKVDDGYIMALGKYENMEEFKASYIHELAHCFDYSRKNKENNTTYCEQAIFELMDNNILNPIKKMMLKELDVDNYPQYHAEQYNKIKKEVILLIKEEFKLENLELDSKFDDTLNKIINNFYKINYYKLLKIEIVIELNSHREIKKATNLLNTEYSSEELEEKFKNLETKIDQIRKNHKYILSHNFSFFVGENKKYLIDLDIKENKFYFTKPIEIFARAFEGLYVNKSDGIYKVLSEEEKIDRKILIKEAIEYMSPDINLVNKNKANI